MIVRGLDENHDWTFGKGIQNYLRDGKCISQNVQTRLLSFLNDCFFDMTAGIDWLRYLGAKNTLGQIVLNCRAVILATDGVVRVNDVSASIHNQRDLFISYNIDTIYSTSINNTVEVIRA